MCLFYFVTGQSDSNQRNVEFVLEYQKNDKKVLSVAPFVDNSLTFFSVIRKEYDIKEIAKSKGKIARELPCPFCIGNTYFLSKKYNQVVLELAYEICVDKTLKQFFENIVEFDFYNSIKQYQKQNPNYVLPKQNILNALAMVQVRKQDIIEKIKQLENKITQKNKFDLENIIDF